MAFHPIPARWFEVLVPRKSVARTMEVLARTQLVEFEATEGSRTHNVSALEPWLDEWERLRQEFGSALPPADTTPRPDDRPLEAVARDALDRLRGWAAEAGPALRALEVAEREQSELATYDRLFSRLAALEPKLVFTVAPEPGLQLAVRLFLLPAGGEVEAAGELHALRLLEMDGRTYVLAAGALRAVDELTRELTAGGARQLELPDWTRGPVAEVRTEAARRLAAIQSETGRLWSDLEALERRFQAAQAEGDMIRVAWVAGQMRYFPVTEHLGWVTGWTSARSETPLRGPLEPLGLPYALHFTDPPPDRTPPSILLNPGWARPFETFARLLGTPGVQEADPSIFVALIAPLLFGYMFGDVGHGAVLLLAGLLLRRRFPLLGLLVPGGIAAIVFGFLFGEIFALEHALPPLWLRPLDAPLTILFAPLVAGACIIVLGLLLDGLTAIWRQTIRRWLARDLGLAVAYAGLWGLLLTPSSAWLAGAGVLWYVGGHLTDRLRPPAAALLQGIGAFAEHALRLLVNTISFVRVGAFALAHAGLSLAVAKLAEAAGPGAQWPVLILGNLLIIVVEGLVVSVQTTRLILFEFFIRFLQAAGRPFRPSLPPEWAREEAPAMRGRAT